MERNQRLLNRYALDEEDTIGVACISYGKDSLTELEAIKKLKLPLHRIIHSEVWATPTIPADLPPMVEFKAKADEIIYQRYGIKVEHICAMKNGGVFSYEDMFYQKLSSGQFEGTYRGFPLTTGGWCGKLKTTKINIPRYILSTIRGGYTDSRFRRGTFKADGHTVHDYDARFQMEDEGIIDANEPWFWRYLDQVQLRIEGI